MASLQVRASCSSPLSSSNAGKISISNVPSLVFIDANRGSTFERDSFAILPKPGSVALRVAKKSTNTLCSGP